MTNEDLLADITAEAGGWMRSHGEPNKYLDALYRVVVLCMENTDHYLVDKDWILRAISEELAPRPPLSKSVIRRITKVQSDELQEKELI